MFRARPCRRCVPPAVVFYPCCSPAAAGSGFLARPAEADQRPFGGIIDAAARRHGVDPDLVHAVIAVESGYRATAQSPAGAQGLMQLMPGTQREFGVVDAFDPRQNVDAGVAYLRRLTDEFGTVVALAAYNAGPGAARRYNGIPPYEETRAYLQAVLARNRPAAGGRAAEDHDDTADRLHAGSEADPAEDASADLRRQAADVTYDTIGSLDAEDASADLRLQAGHPTADGEAELDSPALDEASSRGPPESLRGPAISSIRRARRLERCPATSRSTPVATGRVRHWRGTRCSSPGAATRTQTCACVSAWTTPSRSSASRRSARTAVNGAHRAGTCVPTST